MERRFCANDPTRPNLKLTRSTLSARVDRLRLPVPDLPRCHESHRISPAADLHTMPVRTIRSDRSNAIGKCGNVDRLDRALTELIMDELDTQGMHWPRPVSPRIIHHCVYCDCPAVTIFRYRWSDGRRQESYVCQDHFDGLNEQVFDDRQTCGEWD